MTRKVGKNVNLLRDEPAESMAQKTSLEKWAEGNKRGMAEVEPEKERRKKAPRETKGQRIGARARTL